MEPEIPYSHNKLFKELLRDFPELEQRNLKKFNSTILKKNFNIFFVIRLISIHLFLFLRCLNQLVYVCDNSGILLSILCGSEECKVGQIPCF